MIKYEFTIEHDESDVLEHLLHKEIVDNKNILLENQRNNADPLHIRQREEEIKFLERLRKKLLAKRKQLA